MCHMSFMHNIFWLHCSHKAAAKMEEAFRLMKWYLKHRKKKKIIIASFPKLYLPK